MEDKLIGPLSFKEFAFIAGGCGLAYILYRFIPSTLIAFIFMAPVLIFAAALAFYRPNNKPFIEMVQAAILFTLGKKLYTWQKQDKPIRTKEVDTSYIGGTSMMMPILSENKLTSLSRELDTQAASLAAKRDTDSLNLKI
jgi:uncharacterized membrane protein